MEFEGLIKEDMLARKLLLFQSAISQMGVEPFGLHGVIHWNGVYQNCLMLDPEPTMIEDWFYWCFSMLHDCCRYSEYGDARHPEKAAKLVEPDTDFNKQLNYTIRYHSAGVISEDLHTGTCWDADRLELPRVGITPDPKLMSTEAGKEAARAMNPSLIVKPGHQGQGGLYIP